MKFGSQGQHGWVCDINDLPQSQWGSCCFNVPSGNDGQENTDNMIAAGVTHGAAIECVNINNQGFNDWFLPSKDELQQIYNQRVVIDATALSNGGSILVYGAKYWSSTNWSTTDAYYFDTYGQGEQNMRSKFDVGWVRAVREF